MTSRPPIIAATLELLPEGMITCVCAADVEQARAIAGAAQVEVEFVHGDDYPGICDPNLGAVFVQANKTNGDGGE